MNNHTISFYSGYRRVAFINDSIRKKHSQLD